MDEQHDRDSSGVKKRDGVCGVLTAEVVCLALRAGLRPAQAEDVAQAVWRKFLKRHPDVTEDRLDEQARGWLLRVARHEIADVFRDRHRHPTQSLEDLPAEPMDHRGLESANGESEERALLRRWLEELKQKDPQGHQFVYERHVEGIRPKDLAAKHGKTAHWISVRIHRLLEDFRAWLRKHRDDEAVSS